MALTASQKTTFQAVVAKIKSEVAKYGDTTIVENLAYTEDDEGKVTSLTANINFEDKDIDGVGTRKRKGVSVW